MSATITDYTEDSVRDQLIRPRGNDSRRIRTRDTPTEAQVTHPWVTRNRGMVGPRLLPLRQILALRTVGNRVTFAS